jgi:multidrug resistance efflux pump
VSVHKGLLAGGAVLLVAALAIGFALNRRAHTQKPLPTGASTVVDSPAVFDGAEATLTGHAEARTTVMVGAPIEGVLETWFVEINQEVYLDQLLGRIRNLKLEASAQRAQTELDKTQAHLTSLGGDEIAARMEASRAAADQIRVRSELDRLEKDYRRQKMLMQDGATPRLTFEKSERDFLAAQKESETLEAAAKQADERVAAVAHDLEATKGVLAENAEAVEQGKAAAAAREIRSPADGVVIARKGQPGEPVDPSMIDLMQVATDLTSVQVVLTPEPRVLARIHTGQTASVRLPDLSSEEMPGTVTDVRGTNVIVDFTSPTAVTRLGLTAQVRIKF